MMLFYGLFPFLVIAIGALALMLAESFAKEKTGLALGSAAVFLSGLLGCIGVWHVGPENIAGLESLEPWLAIDRFTLFVSGLICMSGVLASLMAGGYLREHQIERGEFYTLLLFSAFGAMVLAAARDVLTLFLGLETMSLGVYAMTGFRRASARSIEGAMKYFLLGSFAAAILLFGFALLYGATGHTDLAGIGDVLNKGISVVVSDGKKVGLPVSYALVALAMVLILVGLAFKVSAVPFHMWTPDAYEGAPTPATAFMSMAVKGAAVATLLRVLLTTFADGRFTSWASGWPPILAWLAVLTMTVANLIAGRQESVKRMLAYSSIAHAGYILVGVVATMRVDKDATGSVLFYLATYMVSTAGAFGALILCGRRGAEAVSFEDLAGVGKRHPAAALPLAFFLLSLAGIPPTAGFFGKWFIFKASMDGGFYWLTILGFVNSVFGAYYYLKVLVYLYMKEPLEGAPVATPMKSGYVNSALILSAILVLIFGLVPGKSIGYAIEAASSFASAAK
jgi:NADH-quinone oxidoreductase subunit N